MHDREAQLQRLAELIDDVHVAMFTTVAEDGRLVSRPLGTCKPERFDGRLWFVTSVDSPKVRELERNPLVNVAYASRSKNVYVSVSGHARVVDDRAQLERLWAPAMKVFFPEGKDDPGLRLICVDVESAEYWDGPGTWAGKALYFVVAAVTGEATALADNQLIDLQRGQSGPPPSQARPGL
ncbi:MAG TPA: pyridoxamine 5'-phosphate oxidase family protein [Lysobacter sp.]|nr:pyridoxamine 5'-phosphate oxidase family protein [Lysobacter sp.]